MRLKKIQVAGFKSFVDPTDIRFPANIIGIVGPNGCGKSNVIDAVRWVMGESSARMLRGDNMADVIFNGSAARKPVGKASVELIFDNSHGRVVGNYARFTEISVRRSLSRDGESRYYINRDKVRRKDVLDLFHGTGLGPRAYSIIEQGMVSQIVEAKPEDMRLFVEQAAGTSIYRTRRRETETRIQNTRENLARLDDLRSELAQNLRRLKRQSSTAQRYKQLKQEQHRVNGYLLTLKLQQLQQQLETQTRHTEHSENTLQAALAQQRQIEAGLETRRQEHNAAQDALNKIQGTFHSVSNDIERTEQRIEHLNETKQRQAKECEQLKTVQHSRQQSLAAEHQRLAQVQQDHEQLMLTIARLSEQCGGADRNLSAAEAELQDWQTHWDKFAEQAQQPAQQQAVQTTRIAQLQAQLQQATARRQKLQAEQQDVQAEMATIDIADLRAQVAQHDQHSETQQAVCQQTERQLDQLRLALHDQREQAADAKARVQANRSRAQSLEKIQRAALGGDNEALQTWLRQRGLSDATSLASRIHVTDGWQAAADRVLTDFLGAICVTTLNHDIEQARPDFALTLLHAAPPAPPVGDAAAAEVAARAAGAPAQLSDHVSAEGIDLAAILACVWVAESLNRALALRADLPPGQRIVTRDGTLVGNNWLSFTSQSQVETGVLVRDKELKQLQAELTNVQTEAEQFDTEVAALEQQQRALAAAYQQQQTALTQHQADNKHLHSRFGRTEVRVDQLQQRDGDLQTELATLEQQLAANRTELEQAQQLLERAHTQSDSMQARRSELEQRGQQLRHNVTQARQQQQQLQDEWHQKQLAKQRLESSQDFLRDNQAKLSQQIQETTAQLAHLEQSLHTVGPVGQLEADLATLLQRKQAVDADLATRRDAIATLTQAISQATQTHTQQCAAVQQARDALNQHQLDQQSITVRCSAQQEQIEQQGYDLAQQLSELPDNTAIDHWQTNHADLERKITRIGDVNLVAVEEFNEQSTRKTYLDQQHTDLSESLETLQQAIRKIDQETRTQFKATFDKLKVGFSDFFPQLFGGGKADLQLTSDDWLTAGITVMARPPGKRNNTIHLLSGGEKALTAVALLFALFRLNPAPFCLLDEVDAPLDDANVQRYCKTVQSLATTSQMLMVTHNKITMQAADTLIGVTMAEAGVSRLVSVDLNQAVAMAAE